MFDSIRPLIAGISNPDAPTKNNPIRAFIKIPFEGPIDSETAPKIKAPMAPAPIAIATASMPATITLMQAAFHAHKLLRQI